MLDIDTKRRIDTARDILVGKVPDPKSQVEQITISLIYKFMDDMDAESEEMGGERKFFAGEFARYGWAKLMRSGLGGYEILNLYAEAITKMPENPGIPLLFRDIFKNAYLPYRDPETLRAFLKVIDEFEYDHSERLGDAFEYLLSVLGSQGEAGQFRTPRHIIDFIVEIIDPKKNETVLDPACGTAGFLISSYKHILKANIDANGYSKLTPDERGRLVQNFKGYDISPDMVRLSLVNMYLHGFVDPHIYEYDTLTSQERWNEYADVILANPPFMSPKGGIKPHNRFSVQSKRSEVLFVDYIAEHLTPSGRAGIIVPEGIIFQSQSAYVQLRKMLVEQNLVAVVSLPGGVFNPYSGVKTSILLLDKSLAKKINTIAFFKIENDGFDLGAQRRLVGKNDLPQAKAEIGEYLRRMHAHESANDFQPVLGLVVPKDKISANGDYNLSGERYRENGSRTTAFPMVPLGELLQLDFGTRITKRENEGTLYPVYGGGGESFRTDTYTREDAVVISRFAMSPECVRVVRGKFYLLDSGFTFSVTDQFVDRASKLYITHVLLSIQDDIFSCARGHAQKNIDLEAFRAIEIPLPPLEVQKEIVAEIEGYQKVINGAREVVDNYRPQIPIHPEWPMVEVGELFRKSDKSVLPGILSGPVNYIGLENISQETGEIVGSIETANPGEIKSLKSIFAPNEILYGKLRPNLNKVWLADRDGICSTDIFVIQPVAEQVIPAFYATIFRSAAFNEKVMAQIKGAQLPRVGWSSFAGIEIPLPALATQQAIVAEIEAEQALVAANRDLINRFEKKIQATLARVWGEEEPTTAES